MHGAQHLYYYEFGKEWLLVEFEPTKFQELIITNSVADHKVTHPPLSIGGVIVEEKEQLEALGFTIDPRGKWSLHAEAVAKEARKRLGAIRRIAHMLDDRAKMMAYTRLLYDQRLSTATSSTGGRPRAISKNLTGFKAVLSQCSRTCLPCSSPHWKGGGRPRQLALPASCLMAKGGGR